MTGSPSSAQESGNFITRKLREKGIKALALVDDAYDPFNPKEVADQQVETFWSALQNRRDPAHEQVSREFAEFSESADVRVETPEDIDADVLRQLWDSRATYPALRPHLDDLFSTKLGKRRQVDRISALLNDVCTDEGERVVEVRTLASDGDVIEKLEGSKLVFLDYHMGADDNPGAREEAITRAKEITEQIYKRYAPDELPLVILMSSSESVKKEQDQFRRDTKWLNGLFYCVTKQDLEDAGKIGINLGTWLERLEEGKKIQQFVNTVETSLRSAVDGFVESMSNLSLEDYACVQSFSLKPDGQPLGEYMLWLFNSYLGRLAFESDVNVNEQQEVMDRIEFDRIPLNQLMPSPELIEMYDSAVFNKHVGDISRHPSLAESDGTTAPGAACAVGPLMPYLRLGLLFVNGDQREVMMVINADCDLAYTPDGSRQPIPVVSLIGGELHEIKNSTDVLKEPKTEFFKVNDRTFHIQWHLKKTVFFDFAKVLSGLESAGYKPYALMRAPYALEVQRAYSTHFARIGLPVAPPMTHEVQIEIFRRDNDGKPVTLLEPQPELGYLMTVRDDEGGEGKKQLRCRFTTHFGHHLRRLAAGLLTQYQRELESATHPDPKKLQNMRNQLGSNVRRLGDLLAEFDERFCSNPSPALSGRHVTVPVPLYGSRNPVGVVRNVDKNQFTDWGNYLLLVNVMDVDAPGQRSTASEEGKGDE